MGRKSGTATAIAILEAFVERKRWRQSELARHVGVTVPALRKHLNEMTRLLVGLVDKKALPDVFWELPRGWHPAGVLLNGEEVLRLIRLLARSPQGKERDRAIDRLVRSDPRWATPARTIAPALAPAEEDHLVTIETAAERRRTLRINYFTASRGKLAWRHVSVHRVLQRPPARFVATCHRTGVLRWFRVANVQSAMVDEAERFRDATDDAIEAFMRKSVNGFGGEDTRFECVFVVREAEAKWVSRNLLDGMTCEEMANGEVRVRAEGAALLPVARFVVGLGAAATCDGVELQAAVRDLALGALGYRRAPLRAKVLRGERS